jgi:hypothetical protein
VTSPVGCGPSGPPLSFGSLLVVGGRIGVMPTAFPSRAAPEKRDS